MPPAVYEYLEQGIHNANHARALYSFRGALEIQRGLLEKQGNLSEPLQQRLEEIRTVLARIEEQFGPLLQRERELEELAEELPDVLKDLPPPEPEVRRGGYRSVTPRDPVDPDPESREPVTQTPAQRLMDLLRKEVLTLRDFSDLDDFLSGLWRKHRALESSDDPRSGQERERVERALEHIRERIEVEIRRLREELRRMNPRDPHFT